jgi:CHAT domain-containing protein
MTRVRATMFAILIDGQGAAIYRLAQPADRVEEITRLVRESIDGGGSKLNYFAVSGAYALYQLLTSPVAARFTAAKSVIVDLAGPLQQLPIGVLVADKASVASYAASRKAAPYDYSKVDFVARHVSISVALSPRSLIVARGLAPSAAPLPFLGFAQHEPVPMTAQLADGLVSVGSTCQVERKAIATLTRELRPISATELDRAGAALGIGKVPSMTGAAFTDTAIMARTDLNQFQVLHFATHGLTEGQWGCATSPPGLVTSLAPGQSAAMLSFDKIARLKLDANLVVLSACDTAAGVSIGQAHAAGQEEAGASLEGLVRAFLAANARAVLSTYWPISDAGESEDLMADFYHAARGGTIGDALRTAQTMILSKPSSSHPFYWGAFFIVGDSQKPLLSGQARSHLGINVAAASLP